MENIIKILISLVTVLIITSCNKSPIADFTWEPREPKMGQEVKFTNLSKDAKSFSWNFGDMSIGDETNPSHIYEKEGEYIIDLNAQNGLKSDEKTVTINVTN